MNPLGDLNDEELGITFRHGIKEEKEEAHEKQHLEIELQPSPSFVELYIIIKAWNMYSSK